MNTAITLHKSDEYNNLTQNAIRSHDVPTDHAWLKLGYTKFNSMEEFRDAFLEDMKQCCPTLSTEARYESENAKDVVVECQTAHL